MNDSAPQLTSVTSAATPGLSETDQFPGRATDLGSDKLEVCRVELERQSGGLVDVAVARHGGRYRPHRAEYPAHRDMQLDGLARLGDLERQGQRLIAEQKAADE